MEKRINLDIATIDEMKIAKSDLHDRADQLNAEYQRVVQMISTIRQKIVSKSENIPSEE